MLRMPLAAYGQQPTLSASRVNDPRIQALQSLLGAILAQSAASQMDVGDAPKEVISQSTEEVPVGNPYIGNIFRPSPPAGRLSPLGRFNDMGNRRAAERQQAWANARQAAAETYAGQPEQSGTVVGNDIVTDLGPNRRELVFSKYGTGSSFTDPTMSWQDLLAQRHHATNNSEKVQQLSITDPEELRQLEEITRRVLGRGRPTTR